MGYILDDIALSASSGAKSDVSGGVSVTGGGTNKLSSMALVGIGALLFLGFVLWLKKGKGK